MNATDVVFSRAALRTTSPKQTQSKKCASERSHFPFLDFHLNGDVGAVGRFARILTLMTLKRLTFVCFPVRCRFVFNQTLFIYVLSSRNARRGPPAAGDAPAAAAPPAAA